MTCFEARLGGTLERDHLRVNAAPAHAQSVYWGTAALLLGLQSIALSQLCLLVCLACCQASGLYAVGLA